MNAVAKIAYNADQTFEIRLTTNYKYVVVLLELEDVIYESQEMTLSEAMVEVMEIVVRDVEDDFGQQFGGVLKPIAI